MLPDRAGAEKTRSERKFVGTRIRILTEKPFGADNLSLRLRPGTCQTAMLPTATVGNPKNLSANFEFHVGTLNFAPGFRNR